MYSPPLKGRGLGWGLYSEIMVAFKHYVFVIVMVKVIVNVKVIVFVIVKVIVNVKVIVKVVQTIPSIYLFIKNYY